MKRIVAYTFTKEVLFQILLHIVMLLFIAFDRHNPIIKEAEVVSFLNYASGALIINYLLLPKYYYKKKYWWFFLYTALIIAGIIINEELILERIYYPDTRAKNFSGVFYNLLDVLPVLTLFVGVKFAWDASVKEREVEKLRLIVKDSNLQYLKSQINPHFLFNNLNNLYSYAIDQSPKTPEIILELSNVLRYMLYESAGNFVPLSKEVKHLEDFTKLNELQIEERGTVIFNQNIVRQDYRIAPLILSVFVENAFKHATASQSEGIVIEIYLNVDDKGVLHFDCQNNFNPTTNTENLTHGIGLKNVKKRLDLLYPQSYQLKIVDKDHKYSVQLQIDLLREET